MAGCCSCKRTYPSYRSSSSSQMGGAQILLGVICIFMQVLAVAVQTKRASPNYVLYICAGIWCSTFFVLSGSLAVAAARTRLACLVVASVALSAVSAIMGVVFMAFSAASVAEESFGSWFKYMDYPYPTVHDKTSFILAVVMLVMSFMEIFLAIWASGLGCAAACCGPKHVPREEIRDHKKTR